MPYNAGKHTMQKTLLIGNLGQDPTIRTVNGVKVAQVTAATTEKYRDKDGNVKEKTEWHNIVAWRGLAEVLEKFAKKGTRVYIEGKNRTRSWDDEKGVRHYVTEIVADNIELLSNKPATGIPAPTEVPEQVAAAAAAAAPQAPQAPIGDAMAPNTEDMPY